MLGATNHIRTAHMPFEGDLSRACKPKRPRPLPPCSSVRATTVCLADGTVLGRGVEPRATIIAASRGNHGRGLPKGCTLWADAPLDFLQKLFCAACGVAIEAGAAPSGEMPSGEMPPVEARPVESTAGGGGSERRDLRAVHAATATATAAAAATDLDSKLSRE